MFYKIKLLVYCNDNKFISKIFELLKVNRSKYKLIKRMELNYPATVKRKPFIVESSLIYL